MGGSSSKEEKLEILNDTRVKNSLKKFNDTINETFLETVQTQTQNVSQAINLTQSVASGITAEKDINIVLDGVSQEVSSRGDLTALQKSDIQQEVATKTLNDMQTKLSEMMNLSQSAQNKKDEQIVKELVDAVANTAVGAAALATGGSQNISNEQKIQNLLNVENSTELVNKVKNSITQKMVNDTISNIASSTNVEQKVASDLTTKAGVSVVLSNISQKITVEMATKAISESGTAASIIAELINIDKTDIEKTIASAQEGANSQTGTFQGIGEMFKGNIVMMIVSVVASSLAAGVGMFFIQSQSGGAKSISIVKTIIKKIKSLDASTIIATIMIGVFIYLIPTIIYKEHFTETVLDAYLKVGDKYVNNNLCLKNSADQQNEVQKSNIVKISENEVVIQYNDTKALAVEGGNLVRIEYDFRDVPKHTFLVKDGKLSHNGKYIILKDNCLILSEDETNAAKFQFAI